MSAKPFFACAIWVSTWLFVPFILTLALYLASGPIAAASLWLVVGILAPALPASVAIRHFFHSMIDWFDSFTLLNDPLRRPDNAKPLIWCHHPHGVAGIQSMSIGSRVELTGAVAPAVLHMPICRQMFELIGSVDSSPAKFKAFLRTGRDVALIPGGVEEVVLASPMAERAYIRKRKGFVKYAMEFGYDLLPLYHMGETQMYRLMWPFGEPWAVRLRLAIVERFKIPVVLGYGWPFFPLVPRPQVRCITIKGECVECPKWDVAAQGPVPASVVDETHARYVQALMRLYDERRNLHEAYKSKPLEIW